MEIVYKTCISYCRGRKFKLYESLNFIRVSYSRLFPALKMSSIILITFCNWEGLVAVAKAGSKLGDVAGHEAQPRGELDESELNNQRNLLLT